MRSITKSRDSVDLKMFFFVCGHTYPDGGEEIGCRAAYSLSDMPRYFRTASEADIIYVHLILLA